MKDPSLFLELVIFTKQMYLLTVEYLFLFSFPGYFPQAAFVLLSALATAPAVLVCELLWSGLWCPVGFILLSAPVALYRFAASPCFLTPLSGLNSPFIQ